MTKMLRTAALVVRYDRSPKTIDRWAELGIIPKPQYINGYKFWVEGELDASDKAREQGAPRTPVAAGGCGQPRKSDGLSELKAECPEDQGAAR